MLVANGQHKTCGFEHLPLPKTRRTFYKKTKKTAAHMTTHKELLSRHVTDPCAPILYRPITPARAISSVHPHYHRHHAIHPSHSHSLLFSSYPEYSDPTLSARTQSQQTSSREEKFPTSLSLSPPRPRRFAMAAEEVAKPAALPPYPEVLPEPPFLAVL